MSSRPICPHCGAPLQPGALACPECGSDEFTGWKDSGLAEHPDIAPFDAEDYAALHQKEFGGVSHRSSPKAWLKPVLVGSLLLILAALRLCGNG